MSYLMTGKQYADKAIDCAKNYKSLYIKGCFGAPMNAKNKERYSKNLPYNAQAARKAMIMEASADTFGFDCVCLVKGLLWGWCGDKNKVYGGATYASNGVPDTNELGMLNLCKDVSADFSKIETGEYLWMNGHAGIYVGDGLAVECTPSWDNKVQITAVSNIGSKSGYHSRKWTKHGKLPWIDYIATPTPAPTPTPVTTDVKFTDLPTLTFNGKSITSKGVAVKIVQGVVGVEADGEYGKLSKAAVEKFQKANGLTVDGVVGRNTWNKIGNLAKG